MLKLLTLTAYGTHYLNPASRIGSSPVNTALFQALSQLTGWNRSSHSDVAANFTAAESLSGIVTAYPNLEDSLTAIALPKKPLLPGFSMSVYVKDPKLLAALQESKSRAPYAGAFLLKSEILSSKSDTENTVERLEANGKLILLKKTHLLHEIGTLALISSIIGEKVTLIGLRRLQILELIEEEPLTVRVGHLKIQDEPYAKDDDVNKATCIKFISTFKDVLKTNSLWIQKAQTYTKSIGDFTYKHLADFGAGISGADMHKLQEVLEELNAQKRLQLTLELVERQVKLNKLQVKTQSKIDSQYPPSRKFRAKINTDIHKIPKHVLKVIEEELTKLDMMKSDSSEFYTTYNYIEWLTVMPWGNFSDENFDVVRAEKVLDEDHYGLSHVKERIVEFIAVARLRGTSKGNIICLSGPPGVGKTSIGRSIARALGRKFFRFSVGGLTHVSEIKGHRRTYIGALPGKMVQCLKSVGTKNPLILIDEIDKLGKRSDGDPASALLEVMDPEQNANFLDHYLDVTIDLSQVLLVCTANDIDKIPGPLLDRMEVITLGGYLTDEKMHIARDYLVKSTCKHYGIKPEQAIVSDAALFSLIEYYCREAGVRNLKKQIEKIYRKIAVKLVREGASAEAPPASVDLSGTKSLADIMKLVDSATLDSSTEPKTKQSGEVAKTVVVSESNLADYVGKPVFDTENIYEETPVGVVMGLAWTSFGGSTMYIETAFVEQGEGKGHLRTTGQLGDVMRESAQIAHTLARRIMVEKEPKNPFFANSKLHLHVPKGGRRKDGPSAGCTMVTSLLSLAMNKPVRKDLAMTGEVTLTGRILRIGGVKEKTIAARRSQVKVIIFPKANRSDFDELAENVKEGLSVHFVDEYEQIFELAFGYDH